MKLDVIIDDKNYRIEVGGDKLDADDFFARMNRDMDEGWQMGSDFIERPTPEQRCQIAANKLLQSHANENPLVMELMAAYILRHLPGVRGVNIDTAGEMLNTEFIFEEGARRASQPRPMASESEAREHANKDVSPIYKVGKTWRFAVYDRGADRWSESPNIDSEETARRMRDEAHARLLASYQRGLV